MVLATGSTMTLNEQLVNREHVAPITRREFNVTVDVHTDYAAQLAV